MVVKNLDGISFKLKDKFDFSFIFQYGRVFCVFHEQDSGNICFGVQKNDENFFIKVAGALTIKYDGKPKAAIERLKCAIPIYEDLKHKNLIELLEHREIYNGYIAVFRWVDGECMGKQYKSWHKFKNLPLHEKLKIFDDILLFHKHVNDSDYIAIDFYDGSIMYNFDMHKTTICDIDFYRKKPVTNTMGRMWGSSRFMSPEEYQFGADIDEVTNVYLMGATAFVLMGGELDRSFEKWEANKALFEVASKAISKDRKERFQSIDEFISTWNLVKR